jgi:cob(I)alamin adenosyltransferase
MLIIYTGEGKGKTSAAVGQAVRALGRGLAVFFAQFIKKADQAGEQLILRDILKDRFYIGGLGFYLDETDKARHTAAARTTLDWALGRDVSGGLLVLDEALYALAAGLMEEADLREVLAFCRGHNTHLLLTGRHLPAWLALEADLITEMVPFKHPYIAGAKAVPGIEC